MSRFSTIVYGVPFAWMRGVPIRAGVVKEPAKQRAAKAEFRLETFRDGPSRPSPHPFRVGLTFGMGPPPQSWPKWRREGVSAGLIQHESTPDLDNLVKFVMDALETFEYRGIHGGWWENDRRAYSYDPPPAKVFSERPFTKVDVLFTPNLRSPRERKI